MPRKKVTLSLDPELYRTLQCWQVQQGYDSLSEAIRTILQQHFQPPALSCPTLLQRLTALEKQVTDLQAQLRPPQPALEELTLADLEVLNRAQLVAIARDLGVYSYKLNNPALRQAILAAKRQIYGH
ncbi:hypothetical protein RYO59_000465 [Thermosynechococcaceae cyanobacterium Okahandja]